MQKVKSFDDETAFGIELQINEFINDNDIKVTSISYSSLDYKDNALVLYETKGDINND